MKSGKAWVQLGLAGTVGLGLAVGLVQYAQSLGSLRQQEKAALRVTEAVSGRIEEARETIARIRAKEKEAGPIGRELQGPQQALREGPAVVALPALVREHFARSGIAVGHVRLDRVREEADLPDYEHDYFSAQLPVDAAGRNITKMLLAVADLDQRNPILTVHDFVIWSDPENPGTRLGLLNFGAVVPK